MFDRIRQWRDARAFKKLSKQQHVVEFHRALVNEIKRVVPNEEFELKMVPNNAAGYMTIGFEIVTQSPRVVVAWAEMQYAMHEKLFGND